MNVLKLQWLTRRVAKTIETETRMEITRLNTWNKEINLLGF
jgi:hypothetical protein